MRNILVTGGAGFIGSNFIYYLLDRHPDYAVTCFDALTYAGNRATLEPALKRPNLSFVQGDICDEGLLRRLFSENSYDWVINFAAETHVDRSIAGPIVFTQTNILGTQRLLEASLAFGVERFHQVSTDEVYGDLPLDRPDLLFSEESPLNPSSPYAASKAAADMMVGAYARTFGLPATISRCSNNYGRFQFPEKFIPVCILSALADKPLPLYGSGKNVRDWIHVDDHCAAIDMIMHEGKTGETYNVGTHGEKANIELARMILAILDKPDDLIQFVTDRPGHDLRYGIDAGKIESELGFSGAVTLEDGLENVVRWYEENPAWYRPLLERA